MLVNKKVARWAYSHGGTYTTTAAAFANVHISNHNIIFLRLVMFGPTACIVVVDTVLNLCRVT